MDCRVGWKNGILVAIVIAALGVAAFWPVFRNGFVNIDDPDYITENARCARA